MNSQVGMANAMKGTTGVMQSMNKAMDPQKMAQTMKQFEEANMKMEMSEDTSKLTTIIMSCMFNSCMFCSE